MSQFNVQAVKSVNTNAGENSINAIKHTNGKVNCAHIVDLMMKLINVKLKRQSVKFIKDWSLSKSL